MEEPEDNLDEFREVGKIGAKVREESKRLIMVDEPLLDIAENIEHMIAEEGCRPAFPVNISINEIAAHYTPETGAEKTVGEKDVVKIDIGLELNGAIADTAYTVDLSDENGKLVLYPQTSCESYKGATNPSDVIAGLNACLKSLIALPERYVSAGERKYYRAFLQRVPDYGYGEVGDV